MKLETAAILAQKGPSDLSLSTNKISNFLTILGYQVKAVSSVEANHRAIAQELKVLTRSCDIVVVLSQGDAQSVSEALGWMTSQELVTINELTGYGVSPLWPAGTKLLKNQAACPVVHLRRIFVLNSSFMEQQLGSPLKNHLKQYSEAPIYAKTFQITLNGSQKRIEELRGIVDIQFGKSTNGQDEVTLSSPKFENVVDGEVELKKRVAGHILGSSWVNSKADLVYSSEDSNVRQSINIIENCLKTFGPENIFLSFNGGKDCTVLLHLLQTVLKKLFPNVRRKLFCLYVRSTNTFQEQDDFIERCRIFYNLEVHSSTMSIKEALRSVLAKKPHFQVCFMGSRRTDPYCSDLNFMQMTDPDWPQIMRCSPFLDWHYSDIWDYLLYYKVPYCKLYDSGYTSLGSSTNTIRNPTLVCSNCSENAYLPAYKMLNEKEERSGRNVSKI
ncbi:probable FAD synthase [Anthonomus grandis grandis]|uniref:probable FAD synthase n=1 Tax=Anthonomus grandis grandis TaxID=2921223 RepID=UPI002165CF9B|nr:probable FAD synthase [Anthonomus grandis grandis]